MIHRFHKELFYATDIATNYVSIDAPRGMTLISEYLQNKYNITTIQSGQLDKGLEDFITRAQEIADYEQGLLADQTSNLDDTRLNIRISGFLKEDRHTIHICYIRENFEEAVFIKDTIGIRHNVLTIQDLESDIPF